MRRSLCRPLQNVAAVASSSSSAAVTAVFRPLSLSPIPVSCSSSSSFSLSTAYIRSLPSISRSFHSSTRIHQEAAEGEEGPEPPAPKKKHEAEILSFLTKLGLQDYAEKFNSWSHLSRTSSRELREMGLNVKQRKQLLKLIERYKMEQRVAAANAFIYANAHSMSPRELQSRVYEIIYGSMYDEIRWRDANAGREARWREDVAAWRAEYKLRHHEAKGLDDEALNLMAKTEARVLGGMYQFVKDGKSFMTDMETSHAERNMDEGEEGEGEGGEKQEAKE